MKICFVLPEIAGGGIATYYKNLIAGLTALGHTPTVILGNYKLKTDHFPFPVDVIQISETDYQRGLELYKGAATFPSIRHKMALSYACYQKALEIKPSVIEITDYNLLFYSFLTNKIAPTVIRLAGSSGQLELNEHRDTDCIENIFLFNLEKTLLNHADYIIGLSKLNVSFWNNLLSKTSNLHLPYVNYQQHQPSVTSSKKTKKGVVVGRLQLWKGAIFLCEFYRSHPEMPGVDWIGGDNYYKNYSQSMLAYLEKHYPDVMGKQINFRGRLPYDEAQKKIDAADFVLVPSTWDTFNFVVTEAMWKQKVVIASTGAGSSELIANNLNGFIFENESIESLHTAFKLFQEKSEAELQQMERNATQKIKTDLNNTSLIAERLKIYEDLYFSGFSTETSEEIKYVDVTFKTEEVKKRSASKVKSIVKSILTKLTR